MVDVNKKKPDEQPVRKRSFARRLGSFIKWMVVLGFMGALFVGGALMGYVSSIVKDEPVRSRALIEQKVSENSITGFAYFADGSPIGQLRTEEDRRPVTTDQIPQKVIDAVVSIEDNHFYEHKGVDMSGTLRAVKQKVLKESVQTGGSTLTQQLARRVFLNLDRTEDRKVKEILLSLRLERFLTKDEIMTAYLNKVPFGNGSSGYNVYGIKAAAKGLFNINDLEKINIAQAAYLAGLPQLPSSYSAFNGKGDFVEENFDRAINRQHLVLRRMLELGKINQSEHDEALAFDIKSALAPKTIKAYNTYPYLMMETERQAAQILMKQLNSDTAESTDKATDADTPQKESSALLEEAQTQLRTGGYRIYTTINKSIYKTMRTIAEDDSNFSADDPVKGKEQTAAMLINHKTGAILGMIEGRDFQDEQMNYATQMVRQPGSTMKPIAAYLPALDEGLVQPASIIDDSPIILKNGPSGYHIAKNANNRYQGLVTARRALNYSLNIPALKLFNEEVGIEKAWTFAKKLGITTIQKEDYQAQTGVLGGLQYGVTVEELTSAYGAIANKGVYNDSYMISKIVDSKGNIVYKHDTEPVQAFSEQTAYLMTDMLRTVITEGTADKVRENYKYSKSVPIVGKTGSTQNYADVWFEGYTPDVTLGVWVGYKQPVNTLESKSQRKRAQQLWSKILNEVIDTQKDLFVTDSFKKPSGIETRTVSAYSGKLPTSMTDKFVTDIFNSKFVPKDSDDGVSKARYITYNGVNYIPRDGTPSDMLKEKTVIKRKKPISDLIKELQNAFSRMSRHESLAYYLPEDAGADMPTQIDPRTDNGKAPDAPGNVRISTSGDRAVITFNATPENDVVGYRLYRSVNGGGFQNQGQVVLAGESRSFSAYAAQGGNFAFYVTAVDVAGRESAPSATVNSAGVAPPVEEEIDEPIEVPGTVVTPGETQTDNTTTTTPGTPGQVSVSALTQGLRIQWAASPNADSYTVYYSETGSAPYTKIGTTAGNTMDYGVPASTSGWFKVSASNSAGESEPSAALHFQP
ncbi:penicillin-binding protein 1A [Paenibacillus sp. FSL R5-192]|uniref:transglycosylase domain-containing protein n=1 Tax=unclassified Paenibacillus TaxID=185978 RepID=UPI0003E2C37F|nr:MULTISPECIES: transglycosylase domain-containing protein [unclassified Paenibacillus]ETT29414.1 penicillin-binding protein 1A [Paenibacillus sp. FSL R5-192]ETT44930.1 penicillin-binding protein 1A [Paenibacillus sp. FSL H7-689]